MLTAEENEILTRVGPGTPMGELLRRYWTPACLSAEIPAPDDPPLRVRLLGEDLVAFRDTSGAVGLVGEHCPHRGASLYYGRNEQAGLRCVYHGWKFDTAGRCVEMPNERRSFAEQIHHLAYPVHESGGIVWAYMGAPETMTPFRDFGTDSLAPDQVTAAKLRTDCNWIQAMEGNIDTAHISFLHQFEGIDDIPDDGSDRPGYPSNAMSWKFWRHDRTPRLEVENEWYGFRYAALRETPNHHTHVRMTTYVAPYSTLVASIPFTTRQGMFVPSDDEHTWRYSFVTQPPANPRNLGGANLFDVAPYTTPFSGGPRQGVTPRPYTEENEYQIDRAVQRSSTFSGVADFVSQDLMVTESMKPIYDHTKEHLGTTDLAIIRMRQVLIDAALGLAEGKAPPGIATGPEQDYRTIRAAEKILEVGEDWRLLGTDDDPVVREALQLGEVAPSPA
ncbi:MAG TPA: Rieske 2Fe-2S domain-containing protein [Acidimicrobiales bacterium]|nr:Rieske 2Fe-2S domain-containing protein [Acidimicrobiales bacterium]